MKKYCVIFLSCLMCISLIIPTAFAYKDNLAGDISEMKELVDEALLFGDAMRFYFPNVAKWIEEYNFFNPIDLPYYSDTLIEIDGCTYLLLYENLLPGGSYSNLHNYANAIFTLDIAEKATTKAYLNNDQPLFHTSEDGKIYIANPAALNKYYTYNANASKTLEILEMYDGYAIGRICLRATYMEDDASEYELFSQYPAWIECKFVKTSDGWRIDECAFTDMITSTSFEREYCSEDNLYSPSTGDGAAERATLLGAVSLACLIPVACLTIKRRRRSVN